MFQTDQTKDPLMFAFSVRDLVSKDSDVWLYEDLFDQLDLDEFIASYVSQGQAGKDPKLMLRTLFYGLTHGVCSGAKLAEMCATDSRFIVLSGHTKPDQRTFHRFLIRHASAIENLFAQIVRLAQHMGLVRLGRIAVDGSRFKAQTSKHKAMSYGRMQGAIDRIKGELKELRDSLERDNALEPTEMGNSLPEEIARREKRLAKIQAAKEALEKEKGGDVGSKDQKSFNDHDALPMAGKGSGFQYGYNAHAAVDEERQIVVAAELHDSPSDSKALPGVLDKVEENCRQSADEVLVDSGYRGPANLAAIEAKGSTGYVAVGKGEQGSSQHVEEQLVATKKDHEFECIAGKVVPTLSRHRDGSTTIKVDGRFCNNCPLQGFCALYSRRGKQVLIRNGETRRLLNSNRKRLRSDEGRAIYRRRKVIIEPVFGNIKNKGIRILVRGKSKVSVWWKMACSAHNIEKIIAQMVSSSAQKVAERRFALI